MVATFAKLLTDDQVLRVHEASLEILEAVGVEVHNQKALDIYQKHGCKVSLDTLRVTFPPKVVEEFRRMTPGTFTFYGRDPKYDKTLPDDGPLIMNASSAPFVIDPISGEQRRSTSSDIANIARLAQELPGFDVFSVAVLAADAPEEMYSLFRFYPAIKNCVKPLRGGMETTQDPEKDAENLLTLLYIVAGGKEAYHERPFVCPHACPMISPLKMDEGSTGLLIHFAEKGLPVYCTSVPNGGLTSPIPLAATVAQANAEYLAMNVLQQMVNPGQPYLYNSLPTIMDTKSGAYASGGIECGILNMALAQIAQYYQVPYGGYIGLTNSKLCDVQSGYEKGLSSMAGAMAGMNVIQMGMLIDALMAFDYAQAIVDNEIALMIKQAIRPIDTSDEMLSINMIKEAGPGGSFVESDQTFEMMRTAAFEPQVADRNFRDMWEDRGAVAGHTRALNLAGEILAQQFDPLLAPEIDAKVHEAFPGLPNGEMVLPAGW